MQEKSVAGYFLEVVVVMIVVGSLAAVAMPGIGNMLNKGKVESRDLELHNIQTAVTEMLTESDTGTLVPVGPTADMAQVQTEDTPPLVLSEYLTGLDETQLGSGYTYEFEADGTVRQIPP